MINRNFMVKVTDAKLADIREALKAGGIQIRSIIEVFREEIVPEEERKLENS